MILNRTSARGLTLIELVMGISIMAIVLTALGAFTAAAGKGWQNSTQTQGENAVMQRVAKQFERVAGEVLYVVQTQNTDSARKTNGYLFCWNDDSITGAANGVAEIGEMMLVEYVPSKNTIWLYRRKAALSAAELLLAQNAQWDPASTSSVSDFKKLAFVDTPIALIGNGKASGNGVKVTGASFKFYAPTNALPTISFTAELISNDSSFRSASSLTLRTGRKPSNMQ
ncbi:MAG TPA: prepilin-type N-terminal cleavage/methylation domain-containing protein [Tepidisphaeraceae bacterium]|nr:prepilin-type N-terminal cleavage/methylation domain-containing protein [Tepidisphaeraceae bacterium]